MRNLEVTRFREDLSEGISRVRDAGSRGTAFVLLDRANALIVTTDLNSWGRNLSLAKSVSEGFDLSVVLREGVEVVTFNEAKQVVMAAMVAELDHISKYR